MKNTNTQNTQAINHEVHTIHLQEGWEVEWVRQSDCSDWEFQVCRYSNGETWIYKDGEADILFMELTVKDGLGQSEIMITGDWAIVALYQSGVQWFESKEAWLESLSDCDRNEIVG